MTIATEVDDSVERILAMVRAQKEKRGLALEPYFYRSHVTYERELDGLVFRSWLYAGHVSQIPDPGDYFLFELATEPVIVVRAEDGAVNALANVCRHRGSRVCKDP